MTTTTTTTTNSSINLCITFGSRDGRYPALDRLLQKHELHCDNLQDTESAEAFIKSAVRDVVEREKAHVHPVGTVISFCSSARSCCEPQQEEEDHIMMMDVLYTVSGSEQAMREDRADSLLSEYAWRSIVLFAGRSSRNNVVLVRVGMMPI